MNPAPGLWRDPEQANGLAFTPLRSPSSKVMARLRRMPGPGALELFGVHPKVGVARMDSSGALMVSSGSEVVEVGPALIRYADGLAYRRAPLGGPSVPVWAFGTAAKS